MRRHPAVALERLDQCRLLTDDVGAGTPGQRDVDAELRPHDVLADIALGVGLVERLGEILLSGGHLASHIQEALAEAQGVTGNEAAFDQLVGVALHEEAILVGTGLGLVTIDHEVVGELAGRHESPLDAGREAGAAAAEHDRVTDLGVDIGRGAVECAPQAFVPAGRFVPLKRVAVFVDEPAGDDLGALVVDIAGGVGDIVVGRHQTAPSLVSAASLRASHTGRSFGGLLRRHDARTGTGRNVLTDQAERAVLGDVGGPTVANVVDQLIKIVGGEPKPVAVVDLQARCLGAGGDALDILDGEHAVVGRATGFDSEHVFGVLEKFFTAE